MRIATGSVGNGQAWPGSAPIRSMSAWRSAALHCMTYVELAGTEGSEMAWAERWRMSLGWPNITRRWRRPRCVLLLLPLCLGGCAALLPDLWGGRASAGLERSFADYGEPRIWPRGDGKRFKSRTRFFVEPQLMGVRMAIRIEEPIKGKPYGELVVLRRKGKNRFWQTDDRRRLR